MTTAPHTEIPLCNSRDLVNSGEAVPFDVVYCGRTARGFAIRYEGQVYAYLNQCSHVPMEMDYQPNRFFDSSGSWLMCSTHGAMYQPQNGLCIGGPCRGGLIKIALTERDGVVHWHTGANLQALEF
ncbi:MAG: Rieske 2Fe-2S domain-containing protein [Pseudomonadota bacterium]